MVESAMGIRVTQAVEVIVCYEVSLNLEIHFADVNRQDSAKIVNAGVS